jgi:D-xylose 1-dehydrogenase (NADP+, D-xylono-1,5-lactone-forming)
MDVGCYCISGIRAIAGEAERVRGEQVIGTTGIDMAFHGTLRCADDVVGQFEASFRSPKRQALEVVGEDGVLIVEAPWRIDWGGSVTVSRRSGGEVADDVEVIDVPAGSSYRLELENLADAITGATPPLLGRADALGQARTIEALYRSAAENRALEL